MEKKHIGFLHPGAMGVSLAASAKNSGAEAYWVSRDRSAETRKRAEENGLTEVTTLEELVGKCSIIVSVCPPHAALEVAEQVRATSYKGIYADVNAISPQRVKQIAGIMTGAGVEFVDGGIIGGPAWKPKATWLYLSGESANEVAGCFSSGPLETEAIGTEIGKASALKMCFAANTKGTTALLCSIVAAAEELGVRDDLERQWSRHGSTFAGEVAKRVTGVTAKAWRFAGEMEEIASTLQATGLPEGFHLAAADVYRRIAKFKGAGSIPAIDEVIEALLGRDGS
jgi:3-hydroxyisobutyrate dehydrogenase-like beta-hydroxyacid dehydrogenase